MVEFLHAVIEVRPKHVRIDADIYPWNGRCEWIGAEDTLALGREERGHGLLHVRNAAGPHLLQTTLQQGRRDDRRRHQRIRPQNLSLAEYGFLCRRAPPVHGELADRLRGCLVDTQRDLEKQRERVSCPDGRRAYGVLYPPVGFGFRANVVAAAGIHLARVAPVAIWVSALL